MGERSFPLNKDTHTTLNMWFSKGTDNKDHLLLFEDFHGDDQGSVTTVSDSNYTVFQDFLESLHPKAVERFVQTNNSNDLNPSSESDADQKFFNLIVEISWNPVKALSSIGARFRTERRIRVLYRKRAYMGGIIVGYPIVITAI